MAWPPNLAGGGPNTASYTVIGEITTTQAIGTQGLVAGWYVKSARFKPSKTDIPIDNGSALTAKVIFVNDGEEVELTVVDDRSVAAPTFGTKLVVLNPESANGVLADPGAGYYVMDPDYNATEKQPGERVLRCRKFTLFA